MAITGRVPLLLLLGIAAIVIRPGAGTAWLWVLLVVLLVAVDLVVAPHPRGLTLTRRPTGSVRLGEATDTTLVAANAARRRLDVLVRDAWQPTAGAGTDRHRLRLPAGDRTLLTTSLLPRRRGDLRALGVTVRSYGPLRLAARQHTVAVPGRVRALHPFGSRKHLPSRLARLRDLDGRAAVRVRGQGTEFDSLREYVRGDDVRSIDWRASARNRSVVVRTWQPERDRRVVIVLDTSRTAAGRVGDVPRLDAGMDAVLLLAALAARAGDRVDVVAVDRRVRTTLRASGARDLVGRIQDQMADLEPALVEADWDLAVSTVHALGRQRALLVIVTPLEPSAVEHGLLTVLPTLTRHHRVVVASVRDPDLHRLAAARTSAEDVYGAAAAEQGLARREFTADLLAKLGVDVVDEDADRLPPALADHYLALKAQGLL